MFAVLVLVLYYGCLVVVGRGSLSNISIFFLSLLGSALHWMKEGYDGVGVCLLFCKR